MVIVKNYKFPFENLTNIGRSSVRMLKCLGTGSKQ